MAKARGNAAIKSSIRHTDALMAIPSPREGLRHRRFRRGHSKEGIGAMSDARVASFATKMVRAGVVRAGIDFARTYTLRFVNKAVILGPAAEEPDERHGLTGPRPMLPTISRPVL